ncbi:hypothetical protein Tco_0601050 [Tanacetum coccineum]
MVYLFLSIITAIIVYGGNLTISLIFLHVLMIGAKKLKGHKDLIRLMRFLIGLDDTYSVARTQILTTEPLLDAKYDFSTLSRVESYKNSLVHTISASPSSSAFVSNNRPNTWSNNRNNQNKGTSRNNNLVCKHCHMTRHTINRCFELNGYPPRFKKRNYRGSNVPNNASSSFVKSDQSAGTPSPFTTDQINRIMALIRSKPDSDELRSEFPVNMWTKSIVTTVYLINKIPSAVLSRKNKFAARDVKFYETVFPFKNETVRKDLVFEENRVSSLNFFDELYDQEVNKSNEPYDDKRDSRKGDSYGILKTPDYADVSTNTSPTATSQTEEVVTQSLSRHDNNILDDLGSSCTSPKGVDATLYDDDDYESGGEGFVDFNQLFKSDHINNLETSVLRRSSKHHKMLAKFDNYVLDKMVKYDINSAVNYSNLSIDNFVFSNNLNKIMLVQHSIGSPLCFNDDK